ncbi:hypothetical protein C8R45DRAFT_936804 [Mycena sanguinolenta]|nr:hypothetical protein C8R45DRAFT_936804 [Mycena sanguinolenta]
MAQLSRLLTRLKQQFLRTRDLFAPRPRRVNAVHSTNVDAPPSVKYKETPPGSALQVSVWSGQIHVHTDCLLSHRDSPSKCTIQATEEPLSQSFVAWDHSGSVNNIHLGDSRTSDGVEGLRPLTENYPNLLRILGVAVASCVPPSVMRISQVLGLPEEEVHQSIRDLASHLCIPVDLTGKIKLPGAFAFAMYRSCLQIIGSAHGYMACWCLQAAMSEPQYVSLCIPPYCLIKVRDGRRHRLYGWDGARKRHPGPRCLGIGFEKYTGGYGR